MALTAYTEGDTSVELVISIVISLLSGGIAGTVLTVVIGYYTERNSKNIVYLRDQLDHLYGPVYFLAKQNERLFSINKNFGDAYTKVYVDIRWSQAETTQTQLRNEVASTLDTMNKYNREIPINNQKIKTVLDTNFSYADSEDTATFMEFYEHLVRFDKEVDSEGKTTTPFLVYQELGPIYFIPPETIARMESKYLEKKDELYRLIGRKPRAIARRKTRS